MVAIPFLLDGLALKWFRQRESSWPTWAHLRTAFRARFGDINYQWRLDEQMASRGQGEDESAADYLTCFQSLYKKFEPCRSYQIFPGSSISQEMVLHLYS